MWGGYHALLFVPLIMTKRNRRHTDTVADGRLLPSFAEIRGMAVTFCLVVVGWIFFRAATISDAWLYLKGIFSRSLFAKPTGYGQEHDLWVTAAWIVVMLAVEWIQRKRDHGLAIGMVKPALLRWAIYYAIIISLFFGEGVETFIYFQF